MVISGWSVGKRKIVLTSGAWILAIFVAIGLTYTLGNIFQYVVG